MFTIGPTEDAASGRAARPDGTDPFRQTLLMPVVVDRRPRRSDGDRRLAAGDQRREDGAELAVSVMGTAREHEPQPLTGALGPGGNAWIRRVEAHARVSEAFERPAGGQQARFVGRRLPHTACMPPQRGGKGESAPLDSKGIGH